MKIVLTGGHVTPAMAVIDTLPKGSDILFIGRKHTFEGDAAVSFEYKTITALGIPFKTIRTGRLQRRLTKHTIPSLIKIPVGMSQSLQILRSFHPDIVMVFGGYLSVPVAYAAAILKIPVVLHEQTMGAGFSNKLLSSIATKICISWESSAKFFPARKIVLTGNPLRSNLLEVADKKGEMGDLIQLLLPKERPLLYVTGGSSGSHAINVLIEGCIQELTKQYTVLHQTGDAQEFHDYERLEKVRESLIPEQKTHYILTKFVNSTDIPFVLHQASLVISRSGVNTITELLYFRKPALVIPLPFGQHNEQLTNARYLEKVGLAKVLLQEELTSEKLAQQITDIFATINTYQVKPDAEIVQRIQSAAQKIQEVLADVAEKKNKTKNA